MAQAHDRVAALRARKPTVVVDWDGTCVPARWPEKPTEWLPGAREGLRQLLLLDYEVLIHSARLHAFDINLIDPNPTRDEDFAYIREMLDSAGLEEVGICMDSKPPAVAYVDDRAVRFDGDWGQVVADLAGESGGKMLEFETGATRNRKENELAYEGFLSPLALKMFAEYMHEHRFTADGSVRDPDNWQKGMPLDSYMDSLLRHVMDLWLIHRGFASEARENLRSALSGLFFNVQGYMHETYKAEVGGNASSA